MEQYVVTTNKGSITVTAENPWHAANEAVREIHNRRGHAKRDIRVQSIKEK